MLYSIQEREWIQNAWTVHIHDITQTKVTEGNQHLKVTSKPSILINLEKVPETGFLGEYTISQ